MKFYIGDKVKIVNPINGCTKAYLYRGVVVDKPHTNGLRYSEKECINIDCGPLGIWRVNADGCELVERPVPMKEDLVGCMVKIRSGEVFLAVHTTKGICLFNETHSIHMDEFNDELLYESKDSVNTIRDIVEVGYALSSNCTSNLLYSIFTTIWERPKEEVKEMTIADIEALVGCKVKIVKE